MAQGINIVAIVGNLTRDPELRSTGSGLAVCGMRVAVNGRRKNQHTGEWEEDPNFFDVTVFGAQGENCARFLSKGRPVAVQGRLDWREWTTDSGDKRQAVQIIADQVQFLGGKDDAPSSGGGFQDRPYQSDVPAPAAQEFMTPQPQQPYGQPPAQTAAPVPADDDIPF